MLSRIDVEKVYNDAASFIVVSLLSLVGAMGAWLMALRRKVNTNERQIEQDRAAHSAQLALIMLRLDQRDKVRDDDRDNVEALGVDVRELRQDVRDIKNALIGKK